MDRSFLSDAGVVAASRNFVCIRLATYEDQKEADFMKSIYIGRSGQLENTTFGILSPDGTRPLTESGRGPFHAFRGSASMAAGMNRIAKQYSGAKEAALTDTQLPLMKNLDLALNVAAADGLPLVITVADSKKKLDGLNDTLVRAAWSKQLAGQFIYASVLDQTEFKPITGAKLKEGILVVEPGQFGLSGKVLAQIDSDASQQEIQTQLRKVIDDFPRHHKDHNSHVRLGIQLGVDWKTKIPETDPMSIRAKQRARGGGGR